MATIIAEIGFNHEGDIGLAKKMIRDAAAAGADAVKFQTFRAIDIALPTSPHYSAIQAGEMTLEHHLQLAETAKENNIMFLSTPFSAWGVELLEKVKVPAYKVASMDCTNTHLLECIAGTGKPIYLSTGMASLAEMAVTLRFLEEKKSGPVTLLHCLSLYPAQAKDLNLKIIPYLKKIFNIPVGYSDHYPGRDACLLAAILGADVIETHFTYDTQKEGGDHGHSVDGPMLEKLVCQIKDYEAMMGTSDSLHDRPDAAFRDVFRRGLYFSRDMKKQETIITDDLLMTRPVSQLGTNDLQQILGKKLLQDIKQYDAVDKKHF